MNSNELKGIFANLSIWKKKGQRAPHKPLLLLYALAELQRGDTVLPYIQVREKLKKLLIEFGPPRKSYHPEEPFVRLSTDGIWALSKAIDKKNFSDKQLIAEEVTGGFTPEVLALLMNNNQLIQELTEQLLHEHFPDTIHLDIIEEVGFSFISQKRIRRDPNFRDRILRAYEYSCAVCGFNVRLGNNLVGIDAAHIQWHQAGGPDVEENGISLCSLHHKLFDRGVFTITDDRKLIVAEEAHGTIGFEEWLMRFHGKRVRDPIRPLYEPKHQFLEWHVREVFRGPGRYQVR